MAEQGTQVDRPHGGHHWVGAPSPDLSICLVNIDSAELTRACLRSIYQNAAGVHLEVILVDNSPPQTTPDYRDTGRFASRSNDTEQLVHEFTSVQVIRVPELQGFAANNNLAIRKSTGRYILLLNNDTIVQSNVLGGLVEFMDEHPECGAAGCQLRHPDGSLQFSSARNKPSLYSYLCAQFLLQPTFPRSRLLAPEYLPYPEYFGTPTRVDVLSGACMLVRRRAFEAVGLLDEHYYLFYEDVDWSLRLGQAGWQLYYLPHLSIIHIGGGTTARARAMARIEEHKSAVLYFLKFWSATPATLALVRLVRLVSLMERLLLFVSLSLWPQKREKARYLVRSCWEALRWHLTDERREIADLVSAWNDRRSGLDLKTERAA
jgi:hypothetical protein